MLAGVVDENAPHHLRSHGIKVAAVLPRHAVLTGEEQESFVDERGGLQGVIRAFVSQIAGGPVAEFVVHERGEFVAGGEVTNCPPSYQLAPHSNAIAQRADSRSSSQIRTQSRRRRMRATSTRVDRVLSASPRRKIGVPS
jgi:hypothetical protein